MIPTEYPIVCASMNQVSDVKLAIAVSQAGGLPSLFINNYTAADSDIVSNKKFYQALTEFRKTTNTSKIIVSTSAYLLRKRPDIVETIIKHKVYAVELVHYGAFDTNIITNLRTNGVKFFAKTPSSIFLLKHQQIFELADGIILKGPDGAGRVEDNGLSLEDEIKTVKTLYPNKMLIASGGIKNSLDVKFYLSCGADMISIGTLFAMSKESLISEDTKQAMILKSANTEIFKNTGQRAVIFKERNTDDDNNTHGLRQGIQAPAEGHVFAGKGLTTVTEVKHVREIVKDLITGL